MKTALDFSGEDGPLAYIYFVYKYYISPRMEADCQTEEFFRIQDLNFGKGLNQTAHITGKASLSAIGDLMVRDHLDRSNSTYLYDDIEGELFSADMVFGNFESPSVPTLPTRPFPSFNISGEASRIYLGTDREQGFDVVSTANNHALDQGEEGLLATLDYLDELGVAHVGSSRSIEERDLEFPIMEANGIKAAFLAYTFSTNWKPMPEGREYEVNLVRFNTKHDDLDISLIERHIKTARERGADVVFVSLHWGQDYEFYPARRIIDRGHLIADAGADIILGHHPHVLGPLEKYVPMNREEGVPEVLIAYSLGNLIPDSDSKKVEYTTGMILHVELARGVVEGEQRVWIKNIDYTPTSWYCRTKKSERDFRLINTNKAIEAGVESSVYPFLEKRDWRKLEASRLLIEEKFE